VVQRKHSSSYRTVLVTAIIINYELIARAKKRGAFASLSSPPRHPHANHQPRPLFHYAIFSDNVLATSCVVPSVVAWVREGRSWDCHEERARRGVGVELALSLCVWMCGCGRRFNKGFFVVVVDVDGLDIPQMQPAFIYKNVENQFGKSRRSAIRSPAFFFGAVPPPALHSRMGHRVPSIRGMTRA
jgi:hypothetical protein